MTSVKRVSLAEVSRATGTMFRDADTVGLPDTASPTLQDLTECLFFSPGDGRIWLNDQRMVLQHTSALSSLRRELIDSLGIDRARGLLTRSGYVSGSRDAQLVRQRWPDADAPTIFLAGTRLHALEGVVKVEAVHLEFDVDRGTYLGEFLWHHSSEDDEHISAYGVGTEPACWKQLGYAIGYVSGLLGRLVIFREVECRSMGSAVCRVIGKSVEEWGDVEEDLRYLNAQEFVSTTAYRTQAAMDSAGDAQDSETQEDDGRQMVGASSAFNSACHLLQRVAPTQATVLFTGESGVGKEQFANMLHQISPRSSGPFVAVNCAAIPENLMEAELFGVERGAFTGATHSRPGRFERANAGTLFLDEIGCLSLVGQGKLLRALQEGEIERVGGTRSLRVDVRVVAATNVDLHKEVEAGRFREDLYFRLNVFPIHLPPLRERRDDIPLLMNYFLRRYCRRHGRRIAGFTMRAVRAMLNYDFPGNIRELQNLVERGVISANDDSTIDLPHLFRNEAALKNQTFSIANDGVLATGSTLADTAGANRATNQATTQLLEQIKTLVGKQASGGLTLLGELESRLIDEAVSQCDGNLSEAARRLGLSRSQLAYRMKKATTAE